MEESKLRKLSDDELFDRLQKLNGMMSYYSRMGHPETVEQIEILIDDVHEEQQRRSFESEEKEKMKKLQREKKKSKDKKNINDDEIVIGDIEEVEDDEW